MHISWEEEEEEEVRYGTSTTQLVASECRSWMPWGDGRVVSWHSCRARLSVCTVVMYVVVSDCFYYSIKIIDG